MIRIVRTLMSDATPSLLQRIDSDILRYILQNGLKAGDRIPALQELSQELNISVSKLREQLEVARALGIVEVRPRTGIRCQEYDFMPSLRLSLFYGLAHGRHLFDLFSSLRVHVESAYWAEATGKLQTEDHAHLAELLARAWGKLRSPSIIIPHPEHREFHLGIFKRLDNPFVQGILKAYWEAYEAVEHHHYADYDYLERVWTYHQRIADLLAEGDTQASLEAFLEHTRLLRHQRPPEPLPNAFFSPVQLQKEETL